MRECSNEAMRDLLPDLAAERLSGADRARVAAHVAICEACASELTLLGAARRVMSQGMPAMDVARIVAALPKPPVGAGEARPLLVTSPAHAVHATGVRSTRLHDVSRSRAAAARPRERSQSWAGWRMAAAVLVAVGGLTVAVVHHLSEVPGATLPAPALRPTPHSVQVATGPTRALPVPQSGGAQPTRPDVPAPKPAQTDAPTVDADGGLAVASDISELSDGEVESLLQDMNGFDAQPSADPDGADPGVPVSVAP